MIRICSSLQKAGYEVTLVGSCISNSSEPPKQNFTQVRLIPFFKKGKLFYLEFNLRLFIFLLGRKMDLVCAIDLDTILPCYLVSIIKTVPRVYDAHELFCEMKEVVTRPRVHAIWKWVERSMVPRFSVGYTVNESLARFFAEKYNRRYSVFHNMPYLAPDPQPTCQERILIYQGAVNEGRCFEMLIPAMRTVPMNLHIFGTGNFINKVKSLIREYELGQKIHLKGRFLPSNLKKETPKAFAGLNLIENTGLNNYFSLANRFFDYVQAGIPQITMNYPEYEKMNAEFEVAILIDGHTSEKIAEAINLLISDSTLYRRLQANCLKARKHWCWENEEKGLLSFYNAIQIV